jgi:hypothetical protein
MTERLMERSYFSRQTLRQSLKNLRTMILMCATVWLEAGVFASG